MRTAFVATILIGSLTGSWLGAAPAVAIEPAAAATAPALEEAPPEPLKDPPKNPSTEPSMPAADRERPDGEQKAEKPDAGPPGQTASDRRMCALLADVATRNDLPLEFFWRLIWQESRFNPTATSYKGAQGIAQFMPGTARWRGLIDPFEPNTALFESARWLRELLDEFGNLGLAAAAYNAGPRRVQDWLAGRGQLPGETRAYVRIVTDKSAEEWSKIGLQQPDENAKRTIPCTELVKLIRPVGKPRRVIETASIGNWAPWGLQLAGDWSESKVRAQYDTLQKKFPAILGDRQPLILKSQIAGRGSAQWYRVRVGESSREDANRLCAKLASAGGNCIVLHN